MYIFTGSIKENFLPLILDCLKPIWVKLLFLSCACSNFFIYIRNYKQIMVKVYFDFVHFDYIGAGELVKGVLQVPRCSVLTYIFNSAKIFLKTFTLFIQMQICHSNERKSLKNY
ncbi:hypothetical protein CW304_27455 [Bacillus sp. UFRGS-B20]|nr:hypothetical protein CW304_27455 [Bacillus sp. UFRGS-B20]